MAKLTLDFLQPLAAKLLSPLPFDRMDLFIEEEDFYPLKSNHPVDFFLT